MEKYQEVISVHIGQAGIQTGNAYWELLCLEHGVLPNKQIVQTSSSLSPFMKTVFSHVITDKILATPRTVFADLEPTVIDEIRTGPYRRLFSPWCLVSGKEDAASNFARGYYGMGNELSEVVLERARQQAEQCDNLQGFLLFRSFGGGTGSGVTPNLLRKLERDYCKKSRMEIAVYPSPQISPVIVEPYNTVLTTHSSLPFSNCCFIMDNEALFDMSVSKLQINRPTYSNINRIIAQVVGGLTSCLRFPGSTYTSLKEMETNLVPYPRLHFPIVSYSPLISKSTKPFEDVSCDKLLSAAFKPDSHVLKCDPTKGKYISCCLLFRGHLTPSEINEAIAKIKDTKIVNFVDFAPTGFKVGMSSEAPGCVPGSGLAETSKALLCLSNSSAVVPSWERVSTKFKLMFAKRAFVHHYVGEGLEEEEFRVAVEDLDALQNDYLVVFK